MTEDRTPDTESEAVERSDYATLVNSLASILDVRGGLADAVDVANYHAMSSHIARLLNLDAGLRSALRRAPRHVGEFKHFYLRHFQSVARYLAGLSGSDLFVDDAIQEAMLTVWTKWEILHDESHKRGYLFVTAKNRFLAILAENSRRIPAYRPAPLDATTHETADRSSLALEWIETNIDITRMLQTLSPRQREAAVLAWLCDFPEKEIARHMEISPSTVKSHLFRARESLKSFRNVTPNEESHGEVPLTGEARIVQHSVELGGGQTGETRDPDEESGKSKTQRFASCSVSPPDHLIDRFRDAAYKRSA